MPKDKRQVAINRQRKIARQKAKKKEKMRQQSASPQGVSFELRFGYTRQEIREGEIGPAWRAIGLFDSGIGTVVVTRTLPDGDIAAGVFLVDVWCLGVKNAFFRLFSPERFKQFLDDVSAGEMLEAVEPESAVKLVAESIDYARRLEFAPHRDYGDASVVLHGIDTARCADAFVFGREGKPCYASGPNVRTEWSRVIIDHLEKVCGKGNYNFIVGEPLFDPDVEGGDVEGGDVEGGDVEGGDVEGGDLDEKFEDELSADDE